MITKIPFGQTGHQSSRVIFGAFAVAFLNQRKADRVLDLLLEHNINHIDTAPTYGDSELRIGPWMRRHREQFFLATKTGERTYEKAYAEIQQSLDRLQTTQIDLIQFHNLVDPEEWETALGPGGALEAAIEAKKKGYVRFIGVTGHGITVAARHLMSLKRFPFDSVLLPYNYEFMHKTNSYPADFEALYNYCQENGVAVQTIKSVARGLWETKERFAKVWYEPLTQQKEIDAAVSFVLNRPNIFLNSSGDPDLLPRTLSAAKRYSEGEPFDAPEPTLAGMGLRPLFTTSDTI